MSATGLTPQSASRTLTPSSQHWAPQMSILLQPPSSDDLRPRHLSPEMMTSLTRLLRHRLLSLRVFLQLWRRLWLRKRGSLMSIHTLGLYRYRNKIKNLLGPPIFPLFPSTCDWLAASFLNPDWLTKLARHSLVPHSFSRQPKSLLSFLSMIFYEGFPYQS